ncbi:hypothetical protein KBY28_05150 [Ruegeria pomeroyi]|uniref:hypothetical protein n=1 Tax=Ruegeria pomeroyi TaxID=89184 RepID=UPI001F2F1C0A|nr:hypothetical protein [Ruegeria pomeroyi]MCE8507836.1 hypothetical protein [Ruegeria pomeroyi]
MTEHSTLVKANQINTLAQVAGMMAAETVGEICKTDFASIFEVIERLAGEIAEEVEELNQMTQTGAYAKSA